MLSVILVLTGGLLMILSYLVLQSTPFTALGISALITSSVCFAIGNGQSKIPPEASIILSESGVENISAIVEELGLKSKAVYLPSSMTGDKPKALIPLDSSLNSAARCFLNA